MEQISSCCFIPHVPSIRSLRTPPRISSLPAWSRSFRSSSDRGHVYGRFALSVVLQAHVQLRERVVDRRHGIDTVSTEIVSRYAEVLLRCL